MVPLMKAVKQCPFCKTSMTKVEAPFGFELKAPMFEIRMPRLERYRCKKCGFIAEFEAHK
jgi:hypothetical protein